MSSTVKDQAEGLLQEISFVQNDLAQIQGDFDKEMASLKENYKQDIQGRKEEIKRLEKELKKMALAHKKQLFDGTDRAELKTGALIYRVKESVRKAKTVTVDLLEGLEWHDGIRIEKYVDWDRIEKWPDERLAAIGTERKKQEEVSYELKK